MAELKFVCCILLNASIFQLITKSVVIPTFPQCTPSNLIKPINLLQPHKNFVYTGLHTFVHTECFSSLPSRYSSSKPRASSIPSTCFSLPPAALIDVCPQKPKELTIPSEHLFLYPDYLLIFCKC